MSVVRTLEQFSFQAASKNGLVLSVFVTFSCKECDCLSHLRCAVLQSGFRDTHGPRGKGVESQKLLESFSYIIIHYIPFRIIYYSLYSIKVMVYLYKNMLALMSSLSCFCFVVIFNVESNIESSNISLLKFKRISLDHEFDLQLWSALHSLDSTLTLNDLAKYPMTQSIVRLLYNR